jgi:ABC-type proline/glycine betaine transport system permease subunit
MRLKVRLMRVCVTPQWSFALRPSVQITRLSFADVPRNFVNAALANGWDM